MHLLPFGLTNRPSTFSRLMNNVINEDISSFTKVFLDDICVYSDKNTHIEKLETLFIRLKDTKVYLNPYKSQFWKMKVNY